MFQNRKFLQFALSSRLIWRTSINVLLRRQFPSSWPTDPLKCLYKRNHYLPSSLLKVNIGNCHNQNHTFLDSGCDNRQFATMSDSEDKKAELKKRLTPLQYHVTQEKGTERAFTGKYNKCSEAGTYGCVVCDQPLFSSQTKFESGCGWPAFNNVVEQGKVKLSKDTSGGMIRTEVTCSQCNAHLGHVFGDGPPPTKKRFCINSASLQFHPENENQEST